MNLKVHELKVHVFVYKKQYTKNPAQRWTESVGLELCNGSGINNKPSS